MEFFLRLAWPRVGCSLISIYFFLNACACGRHARARASFPPSCLCAQPVCHRLITGLGWGVGGEVGRWRRVVLGTNTAEV